MQTKPILIIGAGGKTGRRVAERLQMRGLPVRAVSRSTQPTFDWNDPSGWRHALRDVASAYVTYQPDLAVPGATEAIEQFCDQAKQYGLQRVVLLSGRGEAGAQRAERVLQSSGLPWTVVRASWFSQNFSESFLLDGILRGEIRLPAGNVPEPFIDADDIADVVTATLTEAGHEGVVHEVTGPRALTFAQATDEIARALERHIGYVQVPHADFLADLNENAVPVEYVDLLDELFGTVLDGRNVQVMNGVENALGRAPTDFSAYVRKTLASGAWS